MHFYDTPIFVAMTMRLSYTFTASLRGTRSVAQGHLAGFHSTNQRQVFFFFAKFWQISRHEDHLRCRNRASFYDCHEFNRLVPKTPHIMPFESRKKQKSFRL